ncbi:hypothetical protein [Aurantimonas sp. 22II-16-19i]|uniref:hypothetical protein n=1 Tax=Aurantimonas sp. 22II-16-19i TaxID=1317114 RepID=UPI0009F7DD9A|nr:hypothetical protein [Aurantimonas sp. 22II-16-19i]ORE90983.1 hypothetical protein ATO4_20014 [Aurantimonas sp. 22II-16-19i]
MIDDERCRACRFWDTRQVGTEGTAIEHCVSGAEETLGVEIEDGTGHAGLCRRSPPAPKKERWPVTFADDWCGEFRAAPPF